MASIDEHKAAMKRLRKLGRGSYVVLTDQAGKSGLGTRFPIGQIVSFSDTWTVGVRRLGQRRVGLFAAGFWQPAQKRLVKYLLDK